MVRSILTHVACSLASINTQLLTSDCIGPVWVHGPEAFTEHTPSVGHTRPALAPGREASSHQGRWEYSGTNHVPNG
jgi:hypothetical protein